MKAAISSLGCKVNLYESEYVISKLVENNYEIVSFNEKSDIYIINTCTVTNTSSKKSRQMINDAKRRNKDAIIIVMGCYSQLKSDEIKADIIIGNKDKSKIIELINDYQQNKTNIKKIYDLTKQPFESFTIMNFYRHTRAFIKIQDGCNAFCTYCVIPYVRGSIRSKDKTEVIKEVKNLIKNGYKEIILTGIHTGKYGLDKNTTLEELLTELVQIKGLYRLRLSSIEINEITDNIINLIKTNDIIAKHLHIPIQSGSDNILKSMGRLYNTKYLKEKIKALKKEIKDLSITTDLIVGFPNETDEDFKETIKLLEEIKVTKIHVFPYSKREKTPASTMPYQIDEKIKKDRVKKVIELSNKLEQNYYNQYLNKEVEVLCETTDETYTYGYTSNYIPIKIRGTYISNQVIKCKITSIENNKAFCEILKNN